MRMKFLNFREKQINDRKLLSLIEVDKDRLYRIAYVYVKNEEDAKEIVQETIYKGFLNIKKLKEVEKFNSWITRILVNTAMTHLKKKNRFVYEGEDVLKKCSITDEDYIDLYEAVDKLQGLEKTVIILKYFEDYRIIDIAIILDISESRVKNYLHKGLKDLRIELECGEPNLNCEIKLSKI
ncbi:MAG TPA: RNA polymerase subunit sigma-70 [Clostridium sp.]|nr:RNA polymerase subunit sigma-70 [Clostridium sp.]